MLVKKKTKAPKRDYKSLAMPEIVESEDESAAYETIKRKKPDVTESLITESIVTQSVPLKKETASEVSSFSEFKPMVR